MRRDKGKCRVGDEIRIILFTLPREYAEESIPTSPPTNIARKS